MAIKYAYHPGNVSHSSSPEVAVTMESFARAMGITLVPLARCNKLWSRNCSASKSQTTIDPQCSNICHGRSRGAEHPDSMCRNRWKFTRGLDGITI